MHIIISGAGPRGTTEARATAAVVTAYASQLRAIKHNHLEGLRLDLTLIDKQTAEDRTLGNAFKGAVTLNGAVARQIDIPRLDDPDWPRTTLSASEALREAIGNPAKHAAELEMESVPAAALVHHATVHGMVDTTRACTTRAVRGIAAQKQLDDVLVFVKTKIPDLMSVQFLFGAETLDVNVEVPSITYLKDEEVVEDICDEINLAHGTTNMQSISPAVNVFDKTIDDQNLRPFYKKNNLWVDGRLKQDLDVLVHGAGLYGADYVAKLLTDAKHIIVDKSAPGGVAINPASTFMGQITVQSREGYIPPIRMEVPPGMSLFPRHYGSTMGLWASTLQPDSDTPSEARELLQANIAYALGWHPEEVSKKRAAAQRILLYYHGMADVHERPHDPQSYLNLGTLLHEGYKRLWNGQGFEADSAKLLEDMEQDFPIICRGRAGWSFQDSILHNVTSCQYRQVHGSNRAAMEASAEAQLCLAAATPPVFAALAMGVMSGVVTHLSRPFSDSDKDGWDMVCSALMLTKSADTVNACIHGVRKVVEGQAEYTTGRHFLRGNQIAPVRECGYGGHGITQINKDGSTSHIGVRWLSTNSEDAAAQLAASNAYVNVLKAVLKAAGVKNPMAHIRHEYLTKYTGTDEQFRREVRDLSSHGVAWARDYAYLKLIRKHTHGDRERYLELFEQGSHVQRREAVLARLGGLMAVNEYRQLSQRSLQARSQQPRFTRTRYIDRFTDIPPRIAEQMLEDTLQRYSGHHASAVDASTMFSHYNDTGSRYEQREAARAPVLSKFDTSPHLWKTQYSVDITATPEYRMQLGEPASV